MIKPLRPSAELYVRWLELGALMPFFRVHCTLFAPAQEPWCFGRRVLALARRVLRRRYRLLPLLYRLALEAHREGLPIVRPLFLHFDVPRDQGSAQFLLGDSLLAAPVMVPGVNRRDVWLPPGTWIDWNTGTPLEGGRQITVAAPLGTTPLFARAGLALFMAEPRRNADETLRAPLALEISVPPVGSTGRGSLFLDDGESAADERFILEVEVFRRPGHLEVQLRRREDSFSPVQRDLELRVPPGYAHASVDGKCQALVPVDLQREDRDGTLLAVRVPISAQAVLFDNNR
jgi:alpha-glucosidase